MNYNNILVDFNQPIGIITINRPKKLNALNKATIEELHKAFEALNADDSCRVIILTGSGDKAFVAGADITEFSDFKPSQGRALSAVGHETLFDFVAHLETPVIAAINGYALGGGLELAMAAHLRIASDNAKMGLPEVTLGLIPGYGGTQRLPELVGKGKAMEMIMTATMLGAHEAKEWGLVNHVITQEELMETTQKLAKKISYNSPNAISAAIRSVNAYFDHNTNGYKTEIEAFGDCFGTDDFTEGTKAFLEKRKPNF